MSEAWAVTAVYGLGWLATLAVAYATGRQHGRDFGYADGVADGRRFESEAVNRALDELREEQVRRNAEAFRFDEREGDRRG